MHQASRRKHPPAPRPGAADAPDRPASHRGDRPRGRHRAYLVGALALVGVLGSVLVFMNGGRTDASGRPPTARDRTEFAAPDRPAGTTPPSPTGTSTEPKPNRTPPARPSSTPTGNGTFTTADASGTSVGTGTIRRYKVQVEQGSGVSPEAAANEISGILADPRGWTADGHDAFQLVSGGSYDFEIKIATPPTVDSICGAAGLHTHGEVNCDVGDQVIVNLKRWNTGSPEFPGPLHDYRALIINHEVGHRIGHGHETCPGPGRPAPAMMQQIDGLHGCVANAWPYDSRGHYLGGPHVP
ncbi:MULTISPECIES: DUF3152 domain-containing protein [unclassified Streptomyces]|uniref:DUF3152 domain-containing protein n=1 Tax=unclassified Streptomyces TaxID=2593676 RepID=UPI000B81FBDA|nr:MULTISPECIES: DUF3152 domain-containing protein [unclassified Streptomyces]MYS24699.1 DUF3152 domain-containing protein [Streptomyces sp. SID4948]